eukprot:TRINITY_DN5717_c0_g2_i4.p1 TRINITY_DN5717_c0_g2~~TRINITY_DN5717_c0_g2_i4.p1  ORF type:complete len:1077 (+),score=173.46 TRINITY_DN5717_c0_g2_i4:2428-5658(+)
MWKSTTGKILYGGYDNTWRIAANKREAAAGDHCGFISADNAIHMPHKVETWLVSGTANPDVSITANPSREVTVKQLMVFLINDDAKSKHYTHIPYYILYMIFFTISTCLLPYGLYSESKNILYWLHNGVVEMAGQSTTIEAPSETYLWAKQVATGLWPSASEIEDVTPTIPINFVERDLVADEGLPLVPFQSALTQDICITACENQPSCNSITYSDTCNICELKSKCITALDASATDPSRGGSACTDWKTVYRECPDTSELSTFKMQCVNRNNDITCNSTSDSVGGNAAKIAKKLPTSNYALGHMLLRQWRVGLEECWDTPPSIPPEEARKLPDDCAPPWTSDSSTDDTYNGWVADGNLEYPYGGVTVRTETNYYDIEGDRFTSPFPFNTTLSTALSNIDVLESQNWIDKQTRAVTLELVFYNPALEGYFVYLTAWVEFIEAGTVLQGHTLYPFYLLHLGTIRLRAVFVFDVLVLICILVLLVSFVRSLVHKHRVLKAAKMGDSAGLVGMWEVFQVIHCASLIATIYFRWWLWDTGFKMDDSNFITDNVSSTGGDATKLMWNWLVDYGQHYDWSVVYLAITTILNMLRLFKYVQYNKRLNALSETVKGAFGDLVGMTLIFFIVLTGFALGGTILYGNAMNEFRIFTSSLSYLLRLLFTADIEHWDKMKSLRKQWTWVYLLSFFLVSWLVLLNMVLAIIAGSFAVVQESITKKSSWKLRKIQRDVMKFTRRFVTRQKSGQQNVSGGGGVFVAPAEVILGKDPLGEHHIALLGIVREWTTNAKQTLRKNRPDIADAALDDGRIYITMFEFRDLCSKIQSTANSSNEIDRIFTFAQNQVVVGENARARDNDRHLNHIDTKLVNLEMQLKSSQDLAELQNEKLTILQNMLNQQVQAIERATGGGGGGGRKVFPPAFKPFPTKEHSRVDYNPWESLKIDKPVVQTPRDTSPHRTTASPIFPNRKTDSSALALLEADAHSAQDVSRMINKPPDNANKISPMSPVGGLAKPARGPPIAFNRPAVAPPVFNAISPPHLAVVGRGAPLPPPPNLPLREQPIRGRYVVGDQEPSRPESPHGGIFHA